MGYAYGPSGPLCGAFACRKSGDFGEAQHLRHARVRTLGYWIHIT
jgi:hypothetical protein